MKFIRIIQAVGRTLTRRTAPVRNKKVIKKPSKKLPKTKRKSIKTAPKRNLTRNTTKGIKPSKTNVKTRNKPVSRRFKIRPTTGYPLQDVSLPVFEDLLDQGYDTATFVAWSGACDYCKKRNGMRWSLLDFISNLQYDAPIFEKAAHVNAQSQIKVSDSKGELEDVYVNYAGEIS